MKNRKTKTQDFGKRGFQSTFLTISLILICSTAVGQDDVQKNKILEQSNINQLILLKSEFIDYQSAQLELAYSMADSLGWPIHIENPNGTTGKLVGVDALMNPIYVTFSNADAARSTRTDLVLNDGALNLEGDGMKMFLWDDYHPRYTHVEFDGPGGLNRLIDNDGNSSVPEAQEHSGHVAGTLISAGTGDASSKGMLPHARCYAHERDFDLAEAADAILEHGMLISNHSYRTAGGYDFRGTYVTVSQMWDGLMYNSPYYLMVTAAGNDGSYLENDNPLLSGYDALAGHELVKNSLSVANGLDISSSAINPDGSLIPNSIVIYEESSWGPTDDLRIKPDIAGNGRFVYSCGPDSDNDYVSITGTSMASPNVAGSLLLVQQHSLNTKGHFLRAATLKGLALHTADIEGQLGVDGPNPHGGWGMLNTKRAVDLISDNNLTSLISEASLTEGEIQTIRVTANEDGLVQVSLSWTDAAGEIGIGNNDETPCLVNDLDLRIIRNPDTPGSEIEIFPWKYVISGNQILAVRQDNLVDPYERIDIADAMAGEVFDIVISHKGNFAQDAEGTPIDFQDYSLIITGAVKDWTNAFGVQVLDGANPVDELEFDMACGSDQLLLTYQLQSELCGLNPSDISVGDISLKLNIPDVPNLTIVDSGADHFAANGEITFPSSQLDNGGHTIHALLQFSGPISDGTASAVTVSILDEADSNYELCQTPLVTLSNSCCNSLDVSYQTTLTCPGSLNGSIDITPSGGDGNYSFLWDGVAGTEDQSGLSDGNYELTLSDGVGCTVNELISVNSVISTLVFQFQSIDYCLTDSPRDFNYLSEVYPIEILSFYLDGDENEVIVDNILDFSEISIGYHTLTLVYEENGCVWEEIREFSVEDCCSGVFALVDAQIIPSCPGGASGSIDLTVNSGFGNFTFDWSNGPDTEDITDLATGDYSVIITDFDNCTEQFSYTVEADIQGTEITDYAIVGTPPTLSGTFTALEDIVIQNGATFTLDAANIYFSSDAGIIVQQGGELVLSNGSLLDVLDCQGSLWRGIDVHGNSSADQDSPDQGKVTMLAGATIRHAEAALTNFDRNESQYLPNGSSGGILDCEGAIFEDNLQAVFMAKYSPVSTSQFIDCEFRYTADYAYDWLWKSQMVELVGVRDVLFESCLFQNDDAEMLDYRGKTYRAAIYCHHGASAQVIGRCTDSNGNEVCDPDELEPLTDCGIVGFRYGLVQLGGRSNVARMPMQNFHNIYASGTKMMRIAENHIQPLTINGAAYEQEIPGDWQWAAHYGIYLDRSSAYLVEENTVDYTSSSLADVAGILIRGSGPAQNELYQNRVKGCLIGTFAYDDNRGEENTEGLKITCNQYEQNGTDIHIAPTPTGMAGIDGTWGISEWQGNPAGDDFESSAGNKFDVATLGDGPAVEIANDLDGIEYYFVPAEYLEQTEGVNTFPVIEFNLCEVQLFRSSSTSSVLANLEKSAAEQVEDLLNSLVDGGDTQDLLLEVILSQYGDALELYYDLSAKSPYLSEEVMLEAIQKEGELPPLLLALILESNPHAAKSEKVQEKLDQRSIPLDEYMRAMIDHGLYLISSKEALEARISHHASQYHIQLNHAIIETIHDATVVDKSSAIAALIAGRETLDQRYLRISMAYEEGDVVLAETLTDALPQDFDLDTRKDQEYQDYATCFAIMTAMHNDERYAMTQLEQDALQTIATKHQTRAAALAQSLLTDYTDFGYVEVLIHPDNVNKSYKRSRNKPRMYAEFERTIVFPNPASDYLIYRSQGNIEAYNFVAIDAKGSAIELSYSGENSSIIELNDLSNGSYTLKVFDDSGAIIDSAVFMVQQ